MGTLTGQQIIDRAWIILQDTNGATGVRWPATEQILWVNDGQREVVMNLPSAYVKTTIAALQAGTRQTLAGLGFTDGIQFMKMPRNYASDGTTPGRAVTIKPMLWLDEQRPNWHSDPAAPAIHCFFDPADPKTFYVWPPANGTGRGEVVYAASPAELASLSNTIVLDDIYANALQYYVLFRSFSKNATYTKAPQLAAQYYQLFLQALGIKDARVKALDANLQMAADGAGVAGSQAN
jgi:hypothetical protein